MNARVIRFVFIAPLLQSAVLVHAQVGIPSLSNYSFTSIAAPAVVSGYNLQLFGINDANEFTAIAYASNDNSRTFINSAGTWTEIVIPGYTATNAFDINNSGQVVGGVGTPSTSAMQAFQYQAGSYTVLGSPSGEPNWGARSISNNGIIVGNSHSLSPWYDRPATYSGGTFTPVTVPGYTFSYVGGVNNSGNVVGNYYSNNGGSGGRFYGFLWSGGSVTTLDITGSVSIQPQDINDAGAIVGTFNFNSGGTEYNSGFLRTGSTYYEVQYPGAANTWVNGVNNNGVITGFYQLTTGGAFIGFTAAPIPEPADHATIAAVLAAAALLWRRRMNVARPGARRPV